MTRIQYQLPDGQMVHVSNTQLTYVPRQGDCVEILGRGPHVRLEVTQVVYGLAPVSYDAQLITIYLAGLSGQPELPDLTAFSGSVG
jgi:hypothetical protein